MSPRGPLVAGALVVLAVLPLGVSTYALSFMLLLYLAVSLAQSWNLLSGLTGYFSLGHGLFFGLGAYTTALLVVKAGAPFWASLAAGVVVAIVVAWGLGVILLHRQVRIAHFAIVTLGLNEVFRIIVLNTEVVGTSTGMTLPPMSRLLSYYALLLLATVSTFLVWRLGTARSGLGLSAIRQDEEVAEAMGVDTAALKRRVFLVSAVIPAIAGGLMARYWSYVDPYMAFDLIVSFNMAIGTVFGGIGTVWGPVIGATLIVGLNDLLLVYVPRANALVFGVLLFVIVLAAPGGLWPFLSGWRRRRRAVPAPVVT
jgi:branched-chain amino acid transport system permease protein